MKLFVCNLPFSMTEAQIASLFANYGTVEDVVLILDRDTGESRGFAFVTIPDAKKAERAIRELDRSAVDGRRIAVRESHERTVGR
jgi:cold-inducible RNA-binding protein